MAGEGRRYQVQHVLGKGGFGTVYLAEMISSGGFSKPVALKVLNQEMGAMAEVAQRLRDEARLLGRLKHPAIVRVDDLVRLDGCWTVVMELLAGANLHEIVDARGPVPLGIALEVGHKVAGALHAAHDRPGPDGHSLRVLHRDIKPSNIQLTPLGEIKVLDFGVARASFATREAATRSLIFGSVGYMAPERLAGRDSHAGDVYALAVVLFEILVGRRLGTACSHATLHSTMISDALAELGGRYPDEELLALLGASLAFDPKTRPRAEIFQRQARMLRGRHAEPWLNDWADEVLAPILSDRRSATGPLSGRELLEGRGPEHSPGAIEQGGSPPGVHPEVGDDAGFTRPPMTPTPSLPQAPTAGSPRPLLDEIPEDPLGLPPLPRSHHREGVTPPPMSLDEVVMMGRAPQSPTADDPEPDAPEDETPDPTQFVRLPPPEPSEPPPAPRPASPISPRSRLGPGLVVGLLGASFVVAAGLVLLFGPWFDHPAADYAEAPGTEAASEELSPSEHEPGSGAQAPGAQSAIDDEPGLASPRSPTEAPDPSMSGIEPGSSGPASEQRSATEHPLAHAEHATTTSPPTQRTSNAAPPEPASVEVTGEATSVVFADGDERFEAGEIPPGKYVILATFPGAEAPQEAGVLTIQAGQELRVRCTSGFDRCIAEVKPPG